MKPNAVILLSGGLDSTTCLAIAKSQGYHCNTITINYGQKHDFELQSAKKVIEIFDMRPFFIEERLSLIEQNKRSIDQINKLIEKHTSKDLEKGNSARVYIDDEGGDLADLVNMKTRLKKDIAEYRSELVVKQDPFVVYNPDTQLTLDTKPLRNKKIFFPVLGLASFVIFFLIKKIFVRSKSGL